ncbi:protein of unknown function [Petrocella atlantisensis]|uniref:Uncharacterized protein n=1 Tax=Petrocella atlantisensis TaxID=2173034 RepID=A0A3P7P196_9FIRM|nr:protein of unknown function [Petrocella atlantisensis]
MKKVRHFDSQIGLKGEGGITNLANIQKQSCISDLYSIF